MVDTHMSIPTRNERLIHPERACRTVAVIRAVSIGGDFRGTVLHLLLALAFLKRTRKKKQTKSTVIIVMGGEENRVIRIQEPGHQRLLG